MKSPLDHARGFFDRVPGTRWCIAFSGGLDSTALLYLTAALRKERRAKLRAVHVDHGIHPDSADWAAHCTAVCARAGVPCTVVAVDLPGDGGHGLEAAARDARYAAFAGGLGTGELLLTAHHADDQAETVLLALLRGSGPAGLAAMPELAVLGDGLLGRPLLAVPRDALESWSRAEGLEWLDDPSNADRGRARNRLRHDVMPVLRAHWPGVAGAFARSASLAAEADALLHTLAGLDHEALADGDELDAEGVTALGPVRARNLLRFWIERRGLPTPPFERLVEAERQLREADDDRVPAIAWPGAVLRRWQGRLHAGPPDTDARPGTLELVPATDGLATARLEGLETTVRFRQGGERIRLQPLGPHRLVKHLLAESGIPPWQRDRLPLLYAGDDLVAVGDLYIDADWRAGEGEDALQVVWKR